MNDRVEYWTGLADYDLDTAKGMLKIGKYLYVGFMCHQTIEKALKAIIARDCANDEIPPKIHNLIRLSDKANLSEKMTDEQSKFVDKLNPLNIGARYPEYKNEIAATLTKDKSKEIIIETEALLCWIKEQL